MAIASGGIIKGLCVNMAYTINGEQKTFSARIKRGYGYRDYLELWQGKPECRFVPIGGNRKINVKHIDWHEITPITDDFDCPDQFLEYPL